MNVRLASLFAACAIALAACSFENRYEHQADAITKAVVANDLTPVAGQLAPGVKITRVQVAEWSDELAAQGKLISVKQTENACPSGSYCFDVKFEKRNYREMMRLDDKGRVSGWRFEAAQPSPA